MAKMGFKAGMALGKKEEGRKEPVPIEVKTTREGLGRDADRKRKQKEQIDMLVSANVGCWTDFDCLRSCLSVGMHLTSTCLYDPNH